MHKNKKKMIRLGYCCINLTLQPNGVTSNRGMIKRKFQELGLARVSELAILNLQDLKTIIEWNIENKIYVYRMSSDIFPWMSEYRFEDLPNFNQIQTLLLEIGNLVKLNNVRVGFHPGQFDVLASPNPQVVEKTIYDLDQHSRILDMMGLEASPKYSLNIHIGGSYGDKREALNRFCNNFNLLSSSTKARLVVENDDKESQYSVLDLHIRVFDEIGCPITFDHFHHTLCTGGISAESAAKLAASTWSDITPLQHFSTSKKIYEDSSVVNRSHSDIIWEPIPIYGFPADIELEVKLKDLALIKYLDSYGNFN
jgi:UV DNA damage endonuclease